MRFDVMDEERLKENSQFLIFISNQIGKMHY